jgi:hypothetical protein
MFGAVSVMAMWFGVSIARSEELFDSLVKSGTKRFVVANFGRGLLVAVEDSCAQRFRNAVIHLGGRVAPIQSPPLPPVAPQPLHAYPVKSPMDLGGVYGVFKPSMGYVKKEYAFWALRLPRDLESYVFSAVQYGLVVKSYLFTFDARGDAKLAGEIAKLRFPLLKGLLWPKARLTPLDFQILTQRLVELGAYVEKPRIVELVEKGAGFTIPVADGLYIGALTPGQDMNMLIIGAPGTGKSLFLDYLLETLAKAQTNVAVLDPTGEHAARLEALGYRVLDAGRNFFLNPVATPNAFDVIYNSISELWREDGLRAFPSEILANALEKSRTLVDVLQNVEATMKSSTREDVLNSCGALLRRLRPLIHPALLGEASLPTGRVVIDLTFIDSDFARKAFVLTFLYNVYYEARQGKWRGIIVIDEADHYASEALDWVTDELRKYGVAVWAVGHSVSRVPPRLQDARYTLIFATKDPDNLKYAGTLFSKEIVATIPYLSTAQAVYHERGRQPIIVTVRLSQNREFKPRRKPTLKDIAAKNKLSEFELAMAFARFWDVRDSVMRAAKMGATQEDYKRLRDKGYDPKKQPTLLYALAELYGDAVGDTQGSSPQQA